jgi:N-acetyl-anhydromuramyl-L-alanine amidase AmpD
MRLIRTGSSGDVTGVAIHHSATADPRTGAPVGNARTFFEYHVDVLGWTHGGYHYVLLPDGTLEYALDERIAAYHAGFKDHVDLYRLEQGQYWNNHYLAICMVGYFDVGRTWRDGAGLVHPIPDEHTTPTPAQMETLRTFVRHLMQQYGIPAENVRGHRELAGCSTRCPGLNFDLGAFRDSLQETNDGDDDSDRNYDCCPDCVEQHQRRQLRRRGDVLPV